MNNWTWGWKRRILCLLGLHENWLFFIHTYDESATHRFRNKVIEVCFYCERTKWVDAGTQRKYLEREINRSWEKGWGV